MAAYDATDPVDSARVPHGDRRAPASQIERDEVEQFDREQRQGDGDRSAGRGAGPKKSSHPAAHKELPGDPRG